MSGATFNPPEPRNALGVISPGRTNFKSWSRDSLEQFARDAADENLLLRFDLKAAIAGWRQAVVEADRETARVARLRKGE